MRIAKPLLLVSTPIGVIGGVYEGWRLAGGLVFLMIAMILVITAAVGNIVLTVRKEAAQERARVAAAGLPTQTGQPGAAAPPPR
jgi:hypothetical protein